MHVPLCIRTFITHQLIHIHQKKNTTKIAAKIVNGPLPKISEICLDRLLGSTFFFELKHSVTRSVLKTNYLLNNKHVRWLNIFCTSLKMFRLVATNQLQVVTRLNDVGYNRDLTSTSRRGEQCIFKEFQIDKEG